MGRKQIPPLDMSLSLLRGGLALKSSHLPFLSGNREDLGHSQEVNLLISGRFYLISGGVPFIICGVTAATNIRNYGTEDEDVA